MIKELVLLFAVSFVAAAGLKSVQSDKERITQGLDAKQGELPFMVSLRQAKGIKPPGHLCGGTIITDTWVLTTATCCKKITNKEDFFAYVGSIYLDRDGINHTISKVILHEEYDTSYLPTDDICVLQVSKPFKFSSNVNQVTLSKDTHEIEYGDFFTVAGWGSKTMYGSGQESFSNILQKTDSMMSWDRETCGIYADYNRRRLCVIGVPMEVLTGDGDYGGPVMKQDVQVAVSSFRIDYAMEDIRVTVSSRTGCYADWFKKQLGPDASKLKFK